MAAPIALIKFVQGLVEGNPGEAMAGVPGTVVEVRNNDNDNVQSWRINLVYTPPGSSVSVASPLAQNAADNEPLALFTPDTIPGSYRLQLFVYSGTGFSGVSEQDIRNFVVPDPDHDIIFPPYQMLPPKLPLPGTGYENEKPDELNIGGQPFGWDGYGNDGLVLDFMRKTVTGTFAGTGVGGFKTVPFGGSVELPANSLTLLEGRTVVDGYLKLNGHLRVVGRRHHPKVLPIVSEDTEIPNNCIVPVDADAGPFTLTLRNRGPVNDIIEFVSLSDAVTPPVITIDGNGPLMSGLPTRQLTTPRESLRLRRRKGHSHLVI